MTQSEAGAAGREALKSRVLPQMAFSKPKVTPKPTQRISNSQSGDMAKARFQVEGNAMYLNSPLNYGQRETDVGAESRAEQAHSD